MMDVSIAQMSQMLQIQDWYYQIKIKDTGKINSNLVPVTGWT